MRICATLFILLLTFTNAQDGVTWDPQYPVQGGQVTIYYDLEDRGILPTGTNPVYIHLGFDGWNQVSDYTMTINNDGLWEKEITILINVSVIDFAFTDNIDNYDVGSWDNNGGYGIDWHIDVYSEEKSIVIINPEARILYDHPLRSPAFIRENESIQIIATSVNVGTPTDSLFLTINDVAVVNTADDTLKYNFTTSTYTPDEYLLNCIAKDMSGSYDTTQFAIVVVPDQSSHMPPTGVLPGINHDSNLTVALFAPEKEFIYLIGDFNDWKVDNDYILNKYEASSDSVLWWLEIPIDANEYTFQYLVDGELRIADPYSKLILDQWNDTNISSETYPNMPQYPSGMTTEAVAFVQKETSDYEWQYTADFERPGSVELVIYELLIRDFIAKHDYNTLIDTLDYLQNLGINAIELLPINEFEGNSSWGYNPSFYFALDKYYGPADDFKQFIDECHRRGIAVIQDIVLNHSYSQSPLLRLYWDNQNGHPASNNPWYNKTSPNPVFSWGYDFNHESEHTHYFFDRVLKYWLEEYKIDGFRLDFTKGMTNKGGDGSAYDASRIAILKRLSDEVWSYAPNSYLILEHFADNVEEKELSDHGFLLWGNLNFSYTEASMGYNSNSDFSWGYYKNRGWIEPNLVTYMESHDEERMMYKNLQFGNSSGDYNIKELSTALDRQKLAAAFFFTLPGPKMIWQFGELGYDYSIDYNGRVGEKPIRWDYFDEPKRKELYDFYSRLLNMRHKNDVFTSQFTSVDLSLNNSNGLKRIGLSGSTNVIIIGNFGVTTQSIDPQFPYANGWWYYNFNADSVYVTNTNELIELEPGEFRIYTNKHLLENEAELEMLDKPLAFSLSQNYPNPFNPLTTIKYSLPIEGEVNITVYNINGQIVTKLFNGIQQAGIHYVNWNARNLTSGVYFYRVIAGEFTETKKMLLVK